MQASRAALIELYRRVLRRCDGARLTARYLETRPLPEVVDVVGIGKAAAAMCEGLLRHTQVREALLVLPPGVAPPAGIEAVPGDHPIPARRSFAAGQRLLEFADRARGPVVALLSGGASALAEVPVPGLTPEQLIARHRRLVASGESIERINAERRRLSALKGGGLARRLGSRLNRSLVLVDVPSGDPAVVGSGPLTDPDAPPLEVVGDVETLLAEIDEAAGGRVPLVRRPPVRGEPVEALAEEMGEHLAVGSGLWVAAGEVGLAVPEDAPPGGRARHLAARVAARAPAEPWALLCGATDGRDGLGGAGVALDHGTVPPRAQLDAACRRYETGRLFASLGLALPEFPPRTNLTDLYLALVPPR